MHPKVRMTESERKEFLERPLLMRIATASEDGDLHNVPMVYRMMDGNVVFDTDATAKKVQNIRETGKAVAVMDIGVYEDPHYDIRGVMIKADAKVIDPAEDFELFEEYKSRIANKYFRGDIPENAQKRDKERAAIVLEPYEYVTWDFTKVNFPG